MAATLTSIGASVPMVSEVIGEATVVDATHDSRMAGPGTLFVAVRGSAIDGHRFIDEVVDAGAPAVVVDHDVGVDIPQLIVEDTRKAMPWIAREVHGRPDEALSILGVTGTNGKTTVVHLCESVWNATGHRCGVVGTLGARVAGEPVPLSRTTPEATDLQRLLGSMVAAGVRSVAMEVSSHALDLHRADAIRFDAVGFTNLTQDHLDFHHDMETYFMSKAKLFTRDRAASAVIDVSTGAGGRMADMAEIPVTTVGLGEVAELRASDLVATDTGTTFDLHHEGRTVRVHTPLVGSFNVSNALVAAGLLVGTGRSLDEISDGFRSVGRIPGRMEPVPHDGGFSVIVDYAHTPDAISTVLSSVRESVSGRLITIVGAGGDRDADKRELMGAAAARFSDVTLVTTDNPRSEDPMGIARAVERGARLDGRGEVSLILDRANAISEGIAMAGHGDMVLILGKGHEQGQEIDGIVHPFDDREVAAHTLRELGL